MPTDLMKQFGENPVRKLKINRALDNCLVIYPAEVWEEEKKEVLSKIDKFNPKHRLLEQVFVRGTEEVALDAQDRILIPRRLIEFAKLDRDIILATNYDRIEIWDKAAYDAIFNISPEDLSQLAFEVLGKKE
jgi:MraZ protein